MLLPCRVTVSQSPSSLAMGTPFMLKMTILSPSSFCSILSKFWKEPQLP